MKDADGDGWGAVLTTCAVWKLNYVIPMAMADGASLLIEQNGLFIDEITLAEDEESGVQKKICLPEEGDFLCDLSNR